MAAAGGGGQRPRGAARRGRVRWPPRWTARQPLRRRGTKAHRRARSEPIGELQRGPGALALSFLSSVSRPVMASSAGGSGSLGRERSAELSLDAEKTTNRPGVMGSRCLARSPTRQLLCLPPPAEAQRPPGLGRTPSGLCCLGVSLSTFNDARCEPMRCMGSTSELLQGTGPCVPSPHR